MNNFSRILLTFTLLAVAAVGFIAAVPHATAQEPSITTTPTSPAVASEVLTTTTPVPAPLVLTSVQPNSVSSSFPTELALTGQGFLNGAVVLLDGYGALATSFVSQNLLTAVLPAGVPAGTYTVRVLNPNAESAALPNALTVRPPSETATPVATATPLATAFVRPQLVINSYGASSAEIVPNSNIAFEMTLANAGQIEARNVVVTFKAGDFVARETGGIQALGTLGGGQNIRFWQPLFATRDISGKSLAILEVVATYTDVNGTSYTDSFSLTFPVVRPATGGPAPTATPTPTATFTPTPTPTATLGPRLRPQLLITSYSTDLEQLAPGKQFRLTLAVQNQGNAHAQRVTMILGGGTAAGGSSGGTPEPGGGLSGAGGEFSKFAPVGSSNVQFVGDLAQGQEQLLHQDLIVNAATEAGAYPIRISFVYNDAAGGSFVDDQVITLLVYRQPVVTMNFYIPAPPLTVGEFGSLPLQLVNGGKNSVSFGTFKVTAVGATLTNNELFIGNLEPGGFFPLDAQIIPDVPGPLTLELSVGYTDDFGQPQTITQTVEVEVMEGFVPPFPDEGGEFEPPIDGGGEGGEEVVEPPLEEETWGAWLWRAFLGLLGLSSAPPAPATSFPEMGGEFGEMGGGEFGESEIVPPMRP
ncbi:MAG: IPT/TIG domain-containing protein [Chloroflexi bacterium]|nr:IPT/TIG domain-containing protein [Chloroflexota bacterium]